MKRTLSGLMALLSLCLVTACGSGPATDPGPVMGNATPAPSPQSVDPAGITLPFPEVSGLVSVADTVAVRSGDKIAVGTIEELRRDRATRLDAGGCAELTAAAEDFLLACGDSVRVIPAARPSEERVITLDAEHRAEVAVLTTAGELVTANGDDAEVVIYSPDDPAVVDEVIDVEDPATQLVTIPRSGRPDAIVRTWSADTSIQDIDREKEREGGKLRVGLGVGRITPGVDGLLLATDTTGSQLMVYTDEDVIRLHQAAPVPASPWAVEWDEGRRLAWVASTAENLLTGFDISQGTPQERASFPTVADAQFLTLLDDGTLLVASASGDGLQVISDDEVSKAESAAGYTPPAPAQ